MKAKRMFLLLSLVLMVSVLFLPTGVRADVITDRMNAALDDYIAAPWPDPNAAGDVWGKAGYALACLYRGHDIATARTYVNYVCDVCDLSGTGFDAISYFELPMVWRIYLDQTCYNNLDASTRTNILQAMWDWVYQRSKYSDATKSIWLIYGSDNHDIIRRSMYMLGLQALKNAGYPYGTTLYDNKTVDQHLAAWKSFFYEYFRQRAREGLSCEIASPSYNKYSLGCWYNIRDLSEDPNLRSIADDYITLFLADYALDFMPSTSIRGSSGNRWYQDDLNFTPDPWPALFGWCDRDPGTLHPFTIMLFTSSYRCPAIVNKITSPQRSSYLNTNRRFGKGTDNGFNPYKIQFNANHAADVRRDTYWTKYYMMGGLSLNTATNEYVQLMDQNRAMGIFPASSSADRIIIDGNGTGQDAGRTGYAEITGVCGTRCLVASWDKNANSNKGINIFINDGGLLSHKTDDASGWVFTSTYSHKFVADANDDPNRNNELRLGSPTVEPAAGAYVPALTTGNGGQGGSGEALVFTKSGNDPGGYYGDMAYANNQWLYFYNSVSLDFYFKANSSIDANSQVLINVPNVWSVSITGANASFTVWRTGGATSTLSVNGIVNPAYWQRVLASIDASGNATFSVEGTPATPASGAALLKASGDIVLGNKPGYTRFYGGKLDNMLITVPGQNKVVANWNMNSYYSKDVYVGIRIAQGGYSLRTTDMGGSVMCLGDYKNSPVVFEVASAADYASATAFQNAVKNNSPRRWYWDANTTQKHLTYTSLAGTKYEYWANSIKPPKINDVNINLNPPKLYNSPYVNADHGQDTVTLSYPGMTSKVLNFNYTKSPMWDDYQTLALWHMDSISSGKIADDSLENGTRGNKLILTGSPTVVSSFATNFTNALSLNGTSQYGTATINWASQSTAKVDVWFKAGVAGPSAGNHTLVDANGVWELRQQGADLVWYTWNNGPGWPANQAIVSNCITDTTTWHHATAFVDAAGNMTLTVDNTTATGTICFPGSTYPNPMKQINCGIYVGKIGNTQYFSGLLDDIKIATYNLQ